MSITEKEYKKFMAYTKVDEDIKEFKNCGSKQAVQSAYLQLFSKNTY